MDNLTDFTNTEDVSDAAIEWVLRETGSPAFPVESVRSDARLGRGYPADCARILAARLIQRHHPELLVDPVDAAVDQFMEEANFTSDYTRECAKRLYLMGIEKGKAG